MERIEPQVISGPVGTAATILWDRWGIAHISADEPYDLGVGLGYAVARERLWQLDYMRRRVRGELAAIMGPAALASDREMLTVGIAAAADTVTQTISGPTATLLAGVAAGINAWRRTAIETAALPEEFGILDYQPAPWTPADSVALWRWRWWMLTGRLEPVALIEAARRTLPADLLEAFLEVEAGEETIVPGPAGGTPGPIPGGDASGEGSNNWAVAGSRTTTGFPVLCSDPHNTFDQPSQWFQAQLTCPAIGLDSVGAVYVGTASAYIGRNRHTAWGVTNHVAPIRDLYIEETDAPGGDRYHDGTVWRPFETERHTIKVRGAADETLIVRRTVRGPIVNDLLPWTPTDDSGAAAPISLRWRGLEDGVESGLEAMLAINCARNADETLAALEQWPGPVLNFVFADRAGRIGYHVASNIPRREIALRGLRPANDPDHAWQGTLPFNRLPQLIDPPRGWVATANNPPWAEDPPDMPYLGLGGWADGYRFRRIRERLEGAARHSPDEIAAIHGDVLHARAVDLLPALLALLRTVPGERPRAAYRHLAEWNGSFDTEAIGASVFTAFWQRWLERIAAAHFPEQLAPLAAGQAGAVARRLLLGDDMGWFSDTNYREEAHAAYVSAVEWLVEVAGPDPANWRWGQLHQVTFPHPLGEQSSELAQRFDLGPFPTSGGNGTVRAAGPSFEQPFQAASGSTYRFLADLSQSGYAEATGTTGQSAHPDSRHYEDQVQLWLEDRRLPLYMDEATVRANLQAETRLVPGG